MGKGKGRQSGGFGSKSLRAAYQHELRQQAGQVHLSRRKHNTQRPTSTSRPRLAALGQLKNLLRERQSQEAHNLMERRRRAGFLPREPPAANSTPLPIVSHPPGWLLQHGKVPDPDSSNEKPTNVEPLQEKCLDILAEYIAEYLETMGRDELQRALSLLPSETLERLSVIVSQTIGVTNSLAIVLGQHAHVEALSFRAAHLSGEDESLTDEGLLQLVPKLPTQTIHETWEDWGEEDDTVRLSEWVDPMHFLGCNVRLKRLELVDCQSIGAESVIAILERCSCITHLSLAGSLPAMEDGRKVFRTLPDLLPALKAIDVTRCAWMSTSLLDAFRKCYSDRDQPIVYCQGCFAGSGDKGEW